MLRSISLIAVLGLGLAGGPLKTVALPEDFKLGSPITVERSTAIQRQFFSQSARTAVGVLVGLREICSEHERVEVLAVFDRAGEKVSSFQTDLYAWDGARRNTRRCGITISTAR